MSNQIFILGANDIEMQAIEALLAQKNIAVGYAAAPDREGNTKRCFPDTAGKFTSIISKNGEEIEVDAFDQMVLIECTPADSYSIKQEKIVVDHHKPGDPGFAATPADFEAGSSLGQVADLLGLQLDQKQRVIAAADHCLGAAYQGECPGVTPEEVLAIRLPELCARQRVSEDEAKKEIQKCVALLENPTATITVGDQEVPDFRKNGALPFMVEAGTMTGKSFLAHVDSRPGFEQKVMLNGDAATVQAFLDNAADLGISDTYGNPNRGFAGGTQS
ncbi:hypothetical protein KC866_00715 [Patescibacteria group bacterium]|nr:hypothetical protein [Patescibacteria group bacterium]